MIAKVAEHAIVYTTVQFVLLKDAQVGRARMGPVVGFETSKDFAKKFANAAEHAIVMLFIYYGATCTTQRRSGGEG